MTGKLGPAGMSGKCTAGTHDIPSGQNNYYEKVNDKWIRCTDLNCFKSQGGSFDPNAKQGRKTMTPEELYKYRSALSEFAWAYAKEKALREVPIPSTIKVEGVSGAISPTANDLLQALKDRRIMASVFYYGIMGGR